MGFHAAKICILSLYVTLVACQEAPQTRRESSPFDRFEKSASADVPSSIETSVATGRNAPTPAALPAPQMEEQTAPDRQVQMALCNDGPRYTCVVDGDTFWLEGTKIRIADIDTPEVSQPQCDYELALGNQATYRLIELLKAGPFELHTIGDRDEDGFGRKLRVVIRDGRSLGDQLVAEGLARTWTGRREPWC